VTSPGRRCCASSTVPIRPIETEPASGTFEFRTIFGRMLPVI
jgi:hypothetical protein